MKHVLLEGKTKSKMLISLYLLLVLFLVGCTGIIEPPTSYNLTIQKEGSGTVNPAEGTHNFEKSTLVNLTAIPSEGWRFNTWIGDVADSSSSETSVLMDKDNTVKAVFVEIVEESEFAGGSGTELDPYLVANATQLNNVRNHLDKHFKQTADIDLHNYSQGEGWEPIGYNYTNIFGSFIGTYDGNGFKISNLYINRTDTHELGLFGATNGATFKNIVLESVNVTGNYDYIAGLVGILLNNGMISNCSVEGNITGRNRVGGLVGYLDGGEISNSYVSGNVTGNNESGGLVGYLSASNITDCYTAVNLSGASQIGGLVGYFYTSTLSGSYAIGDVTSTSDEIGGLVGYVFVSDLSLDSISDCYASGNVVGNSKIGGLIGHIFAGNINNSYAVGNVTGNSYIAGLVGQYHWSGAEATNCFIDYDTGEQTDTKAISKTTVEMVQQTTFVNWDFNTIWDINEGSSYPYLRWQNDTSHNYPQL